MTDTQEIIVGNVLDVLRGLPSGSVQCCVTSPPYWSLRAYGTEPQVWGGSPDCSHEWGERIEQHDHREEKLNGKTRTTDRFYGDESRRFDGNHQKHIDGATCRLCGAWRGEHGQESTPDLFVRNVVEIFREVRRVLREDGTLWLNYGDSYNAGTSATRNPSADGYGKHGYREDSGNLHQRVNCESLKPKDLCMIPERVAIALQADGWYLRSKIPWIKRNSMPSSVTDRPGTSTEYVFLLTKNQRYFYDHVAVRQKSSGKGGGAAFGKQNHDATGTGQQSRTITKEDRERLNKSRNFRDCDLLFESLKAPHGLISGADGEPLALDVCTESFHGAHFAVFPTKLIAPLIKAGTSEMGACSVCGAPLERIVEGAWAVEREDYNGKHSSADKQAAGRRILSAVKAARANGGEHDNPFPEKKTLGWQPGCACDASPVPCTVLDPFSGSGTTLLVSRALGRSAIGIELNPEYAAMARQRIARGMSETLKRETPAVGQGSLFDA